MRMRKWLLSLAVCPLGSLCADTVLPTAQMHAVQTVVQEFLGEDCRLANHTIRFEVLPPQQSATCPAYEYAVKDGVLTVKGTDGVAMCKGFYDFVRSQGAGISSWTGLRCELPTPLPEGAQGACVSPVPYHYYMNVVTFGYSTAYWDWMRWEQEINRMALHGVNMPLALTAQEAISARVFRELGLTDEEIAAYFTGPAHLPWMRMGNISAHDGPLPSAWHKGQVALQHQILQKMRALGMKPICPGFSGFVPAALKRVYPAAKLTQTSWGGRFHNFMIEPDDPLFAKISQMFIRAWEQEFGKCDFYLVDSFNEMEIPFPPHDTPERYHKLAMYGDCVYRSIDAASPGATWVMQGWMFGYQRSIWDERTLAALLSRVPDEKMLLLDLAVDYNQHFWHNGTNYDLHQGFYNKGWVYSVIPNMGGKTGLTGVLEFYANGHLAALQSPNRGHLMGLGLAPEGIENNEVIFELVTDAGWRTNAVDLTQWLVNYDRCRYGKETPALKKYWALMRQSVYGSFTDHPRYGWQFRPGSGARGSIDTNAKFYEAIEAFASCAVEMQGDSPGARLYCADLLELTVMSVAGRVEQLMRACEEASHAGQTAVAQRRNADIQKLMLGMDTLLLSHPTHRLERWLAAARAHGETAALKDYYESNARRIVTIWGPPVDDYAAKIWSGLIRDYYLKRWQYYRAHGTQGLADWERTWVEELPALSPCQPYRQPMLAALQLLQEAQMMSRQAVNPQDVLAYLRAESLGTTWQTLSLAVSPAELKQAKGIEILATDPQGRGIEVAQISVVMDGKETILSETTRRGVVIQCPFQIPATAQGNNECRLILRIRNCGESSGQIRFLKQRHGAGAKESVKSVGKKRLGRSGGRGWYAAFGQSRGV